MASSPVSRAIRPLVEAGTPPTAVYFSGPDGTGKSTLLKQITQGKQATVCDGAIPETCTLLEFRTVDDVINALRADPYMVMDNAHLIPEVGAAIKVLVDINQRIGSPCRILAAGAVPLYALPGNESAVGRVTPLRLWPFSMHELAGTFGSDFAMSHLDRFLVTGTLPAPVLDPQNAREFLVNYCNDRLLKYFSIPGRRTDKSLAIKILLRLARLLGREITFEGIARDTGTDADTVEDIIFALENQAIIRVCRPRAGSMPGITDGPVRIFFFDNGIRNALIGDFSPISQRSDAEALWENFVFMERIKLHDTLRDCESLFYKNKWDRPEFLETANGTVTSFRCSLTKDTARDDFPLTVTPDNCMRFFTEPYKTVTAVDHELDAYIRALESAGFPVKKR